MNPLVILQEQRICLFFKWNIAHLTPGRAMRTLTLASAERLKSFFLCAQSIPEHIVFGHHTFRENLTMLSLYRQSVSSALHIVNALLYFILACKVILALVEIVNFAVRKVTFPVSNVCLQCIPSF